MKINRFLKGFLVILFMFFVENCGSEGDISGNDYDHNHNHDHNYYDFDDFEELFSPQFSTSALNVLTSEDKNSLNSGQDGFYYFYSWCMCGCGLEQNISLFIAPMTPDGSYVDWEYDVIFGDFCKEGGGVLKLSLFADNNVIIPIFQRKGPHTGYAYIPSGYDSLLLLAWAWDFFQDEEEPTLKCTTRINEKIEF